MFEENQGQFPAAAKFVARRGGVFAAFTTRGISLAALERVDEGSGIWHVSAIDFARDGRGIQPVAEGLLPGTRSYFRGSDPAKWHANVPLCTSLRYPQIAPGIDLVLVERDGTLAYDLHVEPGADISAIEFTCHGGGALEVAADGSLNLATDAGMVRHSSPKAWLEDEAGAEELVVCRFDVRSERSFGFEVDRIDGDRKLVIDPGLVWATYFGGEWSEEVTGIDVDSGVVTIAGWTETATTDSDPFPIFPTNSSQNVQVTFAGDRDAFVARFDPSQSGASQLVFSTYIGGDEAYEATDVQIDMNGNVAVCGFTDSGSSVVFPTTTNALQPTWPSGAARVAFVSHLTVSTGPVVQMDYSTYFGSEDGWCRANALDLHSGTVVTFTGPVIADSPNSKDIPLSGQLDSTDNVETSGWQADGYVARIDWTKSGSSSLKYSTYLSPYTSITSPKNNFDEPHAVAYASPHIYIAGECRNAGFPVTYQASSGQIEAMDPVYAGGNEGFLIRIDPTSSPQWQYATFIGGNEDEIVLDIEVNQGNVYACGWTSSNQYFPISVFGDPNYEAPAYCSASTGGGKDAFVVKVKPGYGTTTFANHIYDLRYGTYIGGGSSDEAFAIQRIGSRNVAIAGYTSSDGVFGSVFPTTGSISGVDATYNGAADAFLSQIVWNPLTIPTSPQDPIPAMLKFSTFYGSSDVDKAFCLVMDSNDAYFGGVTSADDLPMTAGSFDATYDNVWEGFAAYFTLPASQ